MPYRFPIPPASQITPESIYCQRREFIRTLAIGASLLATGCESAAEADSPTAKPVGTPLTATKWPQSTAEPTTSWADATSYNNYYEFGTNKSDPARNSGRFRPQPWTVEIAGHAEVTGTFPLEDLVRPHTLEERVYRLRCVEAWSMVIPWIGFPLVDLIKRLRPTSQAKFVAFTTANRPTEMPGIAYGVLDWPYREGLRIDEATHPLTLLALGIYGRELPAQNGAPLRLVVPWKYGFKNIKSIVKIEFVEQEPKTAWNQAAPDEYGFYSNVNPAVDHPRWSQRTERRIAGGGTSLFGNRIETKPFNGYADQVATIYAGMDLRKYF